MLFAEPPAFHGFPEDGFSVFSTRDRERRRRAIIEAFHPALSALGQDLLPKLRVGDSEPLHTHLPRLDWPRGYQPFCTWLVLSRGSHGYQSGPQLNVGVHADHVGVRLGWDAGSLEFGRFEFLCRYGHLRDQLLAIAEAHDLQFAVFASAPWPEGSCRVFASRDDIDRSFDQVHRRGVWWEIGRRYGVPDDKSCLCSAEFGAEAARILRALLPIYLRLIGEG